ncbi:MAG TPA: hypothetical protein VLM40_00185 [Gemmata sp.]|nr:hypothetical protein [Gemmata sp.]
MSNNDDDLADLLAPRPIAPDAAKREALLLRTERALAHARWLHRATKVAAIAAILLVGVGIGWLARPQRVVEVAGTERVVPVIVPVFGGSEVGGSRESPEIPVSATAMEMQAEQVDDLAEGARLYRLAGDAFLHDQDYRNAMRCYRLFLARAGDEGLSPDRGDSWLLTSLKNAAYKEKIDVSTIHD